MTVEGFEETSSLITPLSIGSSTYLVNKEG